MRARKKMSVTSITEGVIWKQLLMFFFPILLGTFFRSVKRAEIETTAEELKENIGKVIVGKSAYAFGKI